jgi:uncharacterized membrane protein
MNVHIVGIYTFIVYVTDSLHEDMHFIVHVKHNSWNIYQSKQNSYRQIKHTLFALLIFSVSFVIFNISMIEGGFLYRC